MNNGVENNQNGLVTTPTMGDTSNAIPVITNNITDNTMATDGISSVPIDAIQITAAAPTGGYVPVVTESIPAVTPADVPTDVVSTELPSMAVDESIVEKKKDKKKKKKEVQEVGGTEMSPPKRSILPLLFLFILLMFGIYTYYSYTTNNRLISELNYKCTPVNETKEEVNLDIESTLIQDLYSKVATSIREDVAQPEWNDTMKLYLAFRQISDYEMYDSNCNMFTTGRMEPYTCEMSVNFMPKAFLVSTLELEWKKLYGETTPMPLINVKLQNSCIGGYEYIPERNEYVQGYCKEPTATSFRVTKTLKEAISSRNTIVLVEEVKYAGNEKMELPSYLQSGTYYYTFRLDMNYNYVLISKKFDEKY